MVIRLLQLACAVLVLLSVTGCQPIQHTDFSTFVQEPRPSVVGLDYRIGVPDELVVTMISDRGVEEITQTLGPDGKLRLKGFGAVSAVGRTCTEITDDLNEIAQATPEITSLAVRVQTFASQKIFVFGQVAAPGGQAYHGTNSVLEVVAAARPNVRADVRNIQVLRPSPDGEFRRKLTVNLDTMVRSGDTTLDVVLAEGDVVFVPSTPIGAVGLTFEQFFGTTATVTRADAQPTAAVVQPEVEHPTWPSVIENIHTTDPQTLTEIQQLREAVAALSTELRSTRQADAAWRAELIENQERQVVFVPRKDPNEQDHGQELNFDSTVYTTANVQRGGDGESINRSGVRFWSP